jgi:serine/threonine protein kinase
VNAACDLSERYRVGRSLGRGPHAEVYEARHWITGREAAIKVLEPAYVHELMTSGRLRDARALAAARMPGVVPCRTICCDAEDGAYVASELLAGKSLEARLARGPLPTGDAILFCLQVGLVLHEARKHGVLHGGLKPSNVFIVPDPALPRGERALIGDFGIATPRDATRLDTATDVHDVACLLHQLLTGAPYAGESTSRLIERGIPATLAILIVRIARYGSLEALIAALEHAEATCAIDADPTDSNLPLRAPPREATLALATPITAATSERTVMFRLVEPEELDAA